MGFLDPSAAIVARLEARLGALGSRACVSAAIDSETVYGAPQTEPAVFVVLAGFRPGQVQGQGAIQQIVQSWAVIVRHRKVSGVAAAPGRAIAEEAAPVVAAVLEALCGWRPCAGFDPLTLDEGTGAALSEGCAYYTLTFTTRTVVRGTP